MTKPKTLEQLRAEKERAETQLAQEQHKLERLENRKKYLEKGERTKRTYRGLGSIDITAAVRSLLFIGKLKDSPQRGCLSMRKAPLRRPDSPLPFLWETRKALNG